MASYAASIKNELGIEPEIEMGKRGQFDILVDDQIVVSRKGGLLALLFRKPWPVQQQVVEQVKNALTG